MRIHSVLLVCHAGSAVGLGHLSRMLALAEALAAAGRKPYLLICGDGLSRQELASLPHRFVAPDDGLRAEITRTVAAIQAEAVVFDLHPQRLPGDLAELLDEFGSRGVRRVAVDGLLAQAPRLDRIWLPSFYLAPELRPALPAQVRYGWDCYLLRRHPSPPEWQPGGRVLVLTGGSDAAGLGRLLPRLLDEALPQWATVCWVQGPYASPPTLPIAPRLCWSVVQSPQGLGELLAASGHVLTVYGVSLFESLQCGRPTVVFSPYGGKDDRELTALAAEDVAVVADGMDAAAAALTRLMDDAGRSQRLAAAARARMAVDGAAALAREIVDLLPAPA